GQAQNIIEAEVLTDTASLNNRANAPQSQSETSATEACEGQMALAPLESRANAPQEPSDTSAKEEQLREAIVVLNGMAAKLKQARFKAGAIDFDRPEMKVLVDEEGRPVDVYEKRSKEANWLIEEFMLLANRTVAEFVARKNKVFVYRVHGEPNPAKLEVLRNFSKGFGYKMGESGDGKAAARSISKLLDKAKGKPEFAAFEDIALRSMAKATYSTDNIGHYGLAFKYYTHFTSPIRRYPDLMVHRLLALYLGAPSPVPASVAEGQMALAALENRANAPQGPSDTSAPLRNREGAQPSQEFYEQECRHASEREIVAADAERTSVKYKLVEFMQDKVGQEFVGHISGLTEWGMYVAIEPTHIEGMVPLRTVRSDFFEFDENLYRVVGRRTHKVYRLGDEVRVKVGSANLEQRLLDYELVEEIVKAVPKETGHGSEPEVSAGPSRTAKSSRSSKAAKEGKVAKASRSGKTTKSGKSSKSRKKE
ncbi:MAG: RNB domain-containing ribonuclease, partial [Bacteroidales bacterium]|nr:RNB domain-containing ribonuclease [Candidatus Cryptobacteroides equifaecalis]